jgi:hypothetical protein
MLLLCSVTMPVPLVSVHTSWRLHGTRLSISQDRVDLAEPLFVISRRMLRVRMIHDASIANSDTRLQMGGSRRSALRHTARVCRELPLSSCFASARFRDEPS